MKKIELKLLSFLITSILYYLNFWFLYHYNPIKILPEMLKSQGLSQIPRPNEIIPYITLYILFYINLILLYDIYNERRLYIDYTDSKIEFCIKTLFEILKVTIICTTAVSTVTTTRSAIEWTTSTTMPRTVTSFVTGKVQSIVKSIEDRGVTIPTLTHQTTQRQIDYPSEGIIWDSPTWDEYMIVPFTGTRIPYEQVPLPVGMLRIFGRYGASIIPAQMAIAFMVYVRLERYINLEDFLVLKPLFVLTYFNWRLYWYPSVFSIIDLGLMIFMSSFFWIQFWTALINAFGPFRIPQQARYIYIPIRGPFTFWHEPGRWLGNQQNRGLIPWLVVMYGYQFFVLAMNLLIIFGYQPNRSGMYYESPPLKTSHQTLDVRDLVIPG